MVNISPFSQTTRGQYIYQQYRGLQWLRDYANFIDKYIQNKYYNKLESMWDAIDVAASQSPFLTYYTKWYFGLYRPLGGASISDYYDIGLSYDNNRIYDDAQDINGLIGPEEYLKYIRFIYDYSQQTWTLDYLMSFASDYCQIPIDNITLDLSDIKQVQIILPITDRTQEFAKLVINYYDEMCLPFGNVVNFKVEEV